MNELVKKGIKVGLTLSLISGGAAALIGVTNVLTAPIIENNASAKLRDSLGKVFEDIADVSKQTYEAVEVDAKATYITEKYIVSDGANEVGKIYHVYGKNSYGSIELLVGIKKNENNEAVLHKMVELSIDQSYKGTLVENYFNPVNAGTRSYEDSKCGASVGAGLIKSMVAECIDDANGVSGDDKAKELEFMKQVFKDVDPETQTFDKLSIKEEFTYIKDIYLVKSGSNELGYIYKVDGEGDYYEEDEKLIGHLGMFVGISDLEIVNSVVYDDTFSFAAMFEGTYLTNVTSSNYENVSCGATYTATLAKNMFKEILGHATKTQNSSLAKVFKNETSSDLTFNKVNLTEGAANKYIKKIYVALKGETELGYVYKVSGTRVFTNEEQEDEKGSLSLLVGINETGIINIIVEEDTFSYGAMFEEGYLAPVASGEKAYNDVSGVGATETSRLASMMIKEALDDYNVKKGGM